MLAPLILILGDESTADEKLEPLEKKVELIFSPKEPNPHDPVLFLILVSGTEKEEPARYWIIHVGVINLTSLSRFAGTVPLSKVGDIEYLIYTSKQVLCSQTAG